IRRIHGNTTHCGKNSGRQAAQAQKPAEMTKEQQIAELKKQLDAAVQEQDFERAAELRDKIKEMEG
ncbi:MAG: UvrB/UvrC motif-containing protein, partial [Ruminococcus sp.]|nr:UvrB/UvrC motif-containing protein [Ruminococcus sp.]